MKRGMYLTSYLIRIVIFFVVLAGIAVFMLFLIHKFKESSGMG
jgi:hypothetical protein